MSHTMKVCERVIDQRLKTEVGISLPLQQFGFMPGRSTKEAIFALGQLVEKYKEGQYNVHCIFIDLEKDYYCVPREEVWNCLREKRVCKKYIELIYDMYEENKTQIRCSTGTAEALQRHSWSAPGIGTEPTTVLHSHGQSDRGREKRDTTDDDVCGRRRFVYGDRGRSGEKAGGVAK